MPRVNIPVTQIVMTGTAPPAQVVGDPANDHELAYNDGRIFIEATNVHATVPQTVTVVTPGTQSGLAVEDLAVSVPAANGVRLIGPLAPSLYNQVDGKVSIDVTSGDLRFRAYHL